MKNNQLRLRLLPNYFKKIGIGILVLTFLFIFVNKFNILTVEKTIAIIIYKTGLLLSFLILAMSEEKIEDELTAHIRLLSLALTLYASAFYVIISFFWSLLFGGNPEVSGNASLFMCLIYGLYLISFRRRLKYR